MSGNRPQQNAGGASSVPSTSSGTSNSNGGGSNAVISNGNNSGTVVPSRTLAAASGLSVPTLAAVPSGRGGFASLSRPSGSSGSRKKAHHQTPLYNGLLNSYEDKSNDFVWLVFLRLTLTLWLLAAFWLSTLPAPSASKWLKRHIWQSVDTVFGKYGTHIWKLILDLCDIIEGPFAKNIIPSCILIVHNACTYPLMSLIWIISIIGFIESLVLLKHFSLRCSVSLFLTLFCGFCLL